MTFTPSITKIPNRKFLSFIRFASGLCIFLFLGIQVSFAQLETNCENSNFSLGNFDGWVGCYGTFDPPPEGLRPCTTLGFHPNRHVIIPAPGTYDPQTCDSLITVYPGEAYSARLGSIAWGGLAEQLKYTLTIDEDSYLFIYRYAVVFEDQGHNSQQQPAFKIEIQDDGGHVIDSTCGYYYVSAQPGLPGWHDCDAVGGETRRWKEWTTVGMDMTPYFGEEITIVFTTRGCWYTVHQGYAYINTYCSSLDLEIGLCEGDTNAVLTAPPGFYYYWYTVNGDTTINGDTTNSIIINTPVTGDQYFCQLTSYNGCEALISQLLSYTVIHAGFTTSNQCAGVPTTFTDTSTVNQNDVTNWKWDFGDGTPILEGIQNPAHTYAVPDTFDVTLIAFSTEGCSDTITLPIIIDSLPNVNNDTLRKTICSKATTDITLSSEISNTLFTWTAVSLSSDITGYYDNSTQASYLNDTLINTGSEIDSVMYTVTPHTSNCTGFDTLFTVLVYPLPILSDTTLVKSICDSTETAVDLESNNDSTRFTWTCTASSVNVTGYSDNTTTPDTLINQLLRNSGYDIDTVYYHLLPQSYGCFGDTITFKVAVYPVPDLSNSPVLQDQCNVQSTSLTLLSNVANTTFTWSAYASSISLSGYSGNSGPGTTSIDQTLTNSGYNIDTVTYRLMPSANGCYGDSTDYQVVVFPTPDLSNSPPVEAQCNNIQTSITLTSNVNSTLFTWRAFASTGNLTGFSNNTGPPDTLINQTLINSGYTIDTVYYRLVPSANGCAGDSTDYKVAVYPTPDLSNSPPLQTQCNSQATGITLTSNVANTTFTWKAYTSSANITGFSDNTGPGVTSIDQTLVNSGYDIDTVTYRLLPSANGCVSDSVDFTVVVYPTPDLSNTPLVDAQCNNVQTNITLTSNVSNTTFTWRAFATSANITGFISNTGPGALAINQTLVNTGYDIDTVYYRLLPSANGCVGDSTDYKMAVYPEPDLSNSPTLQEQCNGQTTGITLTSNVASTTFTWRAFASSANITGFSDNTGPGTTTINHTLVNSGFDIDTVTYRLLPSANNCNGDSIDFNVVVFPTPDLSNSPAIQTQCNNQLTGITLTSNIANTTFTWRAFASSGNITGFSNNTGPGVTTIDQALVNSGYDIDTVTYRLLPLANNCTGDSVDYKVVVFPTPDLSNNPVLQEQCNNQNTSLALTSNVANTTFTWRAFASSGNITGFSDNTGPGVIAINQTLVNSGYDIDTVTYRLMPMANNCNGDSIDYNVIVFPTPDLSNNPLSQEQCNSQATGITLTSNVANTTFTWKAYTSSANITGFSDNTGPGVTSIDQTLVNSGYDIDTVTYRLLPSANSCVSDSVDFTVVVYPTPDLSNTPLVDAQCNNVQTNITLTSNVNNTTFTWRAFATSANITGFISNTGPGTLAINQTLVNTGYDIDTVYYRLLPSANGCVGDSTDYKMAVYPEPDLSNSPTLQEQCNGQTTGITLTSNVASTTFTWRAFASSANITGFSDNTGPGITTINHILTNSGFDIDTVTYRLLPSANNCNGDSIDFNVVVFPTPDLSNSPAIQTQCNNQLTGITLTSNIANTTFTWRAFASSGNITGFSNNTGPGVTTIDQALVNSGYDIDTVTYRLLPLANNCTGDSVDYKVVVFPTPDLSNNPVLQEQCNNQNTSLALTSNVANTTFTWRAFASSGNITGFSDNTGPGVIAINQTLVNSGYDIDTVTYRLMPMANNCNGDSIDYNVIVFPTPDLSNNPLSQEQCNNQNTSLTLTSNVANTTFTWTCTQASGNVTGWSENPGPGANLINQTLLLSGWINDSVIYHLTPGANGCDGPVTDYTVNVNPITELTVSPMFDSICSEETTNVNLTATVLGTGFSWTATQGVGNINGFSDGSGALIAQQLFNPDVVPGSVLYTITPATTSCTGEDTTFTMWVKPLPHLTNLPKGDSICNNTGPNITLTSDVTNTWFTWTATGSSGNILGYADQTTPTTLLNQTLTNSGFVYEWVTYQVAPTSAGCDGPDSNYVVTVYPVPDLSNNPPDTAICNGQATGVVLSSNVTGTLFTWTATGSSILVSGYSDQTTPTDTLDQILFNTGYDIETVTYTLTPNANGCDGIDTSFVVTVYPVPDVSNTPMLKEICNNNNTDIDLTSNVSGTLFTWTATGSSVNITGYFDNTIPATHIGDNLINLGDVNETVTYHITPHANGCDGVIVDYVVTVVPSPYLTNNPLKQNQCNNLNTNITLESNVAGTEFTWTCTASSGNISGYSNSTTPGTLIDQTLINSGFDIDSVIYHVTPQNSGCPGSVTDYSVVVYPVPDVYFVPNGETVCEGVTSNIQNQSHVLGATFSWIATASSPNLSGYSDDSGDLIAQTIDNTGFTIETVTYNVTPEANGCPPGTTQPVILTVNPRPVVTNAVTSFSQCNNATTAILLQADVTGSTFAWRAFASSANLSGFSNGTGATIVQTLVNDGYDIDSVTYRIAATANSCPGDSTDFVVVVFPVADVIFTPNSQTLCSGQTTGIDITSNVASTSFTWTAVGSSPDVYGYGNGSGDLIQDTLYNSGYMIPTVTYTVVPTANGCQGTSNQVVVTVNPLPVVSMTVCFDTLTTTEAQPFELKGALPIGGIFSGNGVTGSTFYPAIAGADTNLIKYTYTNEFGCIDSSFITIVTRNPMPFICGDTLIDIRDSIQYPTSEINGQCWMAVNLNFGNIIASAQMQRDNCVNEKYCYNDNPANCTSFGGLYQWNEMMSYTTGSRDQGFCPPGWHIPSEADWNTLFAVYISSGFAGSALKITGYSGFDALLTGIRFHNNIWKFPASDPILRSILFWSSTIHGLDKAWAHGMNEVAIDIDYTPSVSFYPALRSNAFAIRCIKD